LPAFLSAGLRFLLAGAVLALILTLRGRSLRVERRELASSALLGIALLGLGVGVVTLAETRIDSSTAAMIVGSVPLQVILLRTLARERVALATQLSVLVGLAGLALIVVPGIDGASSAIGLALMVGATVSWSLGSFFAHRLPLPEDGFVASTWQMLCAGVLPAGARCRDGRGGRRRYRRLQPRVRRRLALPRPGRHSDRLHRVHLAAAERSHLEGGHAPVREPARRAPARGVLLDEQITLTTGVGAALIVGSVFVAVRQENQSARILSAECADVRTTPADQAA
jgi:drug/metabolite transporter (DMT)-like permease